jgi:hypothetical protein
MIDDLACSCYPCLKDLFKRTNSDKPVMRSFVIDALVIQGYHRTNNAHDGATRRSEGSLLAREVTEAPTVGGCSTTSATTTAIAKATASTATATEASSTTSATTVTEPATTAATASAEATAATGGGVAVLGTGLAVVETNGAAGNLSAVHSLESCTGFLSGREGDVAEALRRTGLTVGW